MIDQILVRPFNPTQDIQFIIATWLHSYRQSSPYTKRIKFSYYYKYQHEFIHRLITQASTEIKVAALIEDPDVILGYIVSSKANIVHYTFVKKDWRKFGISNKLLQALELTDTVEFTHWTDPMAEYVSKHSNFKYNPYLFFKE